MTNKAQAARDALNAYVRATGIDDEGQVYTGLYHLLDGLHALCAIEGVSLAGTLAELLRDIAEDPCEPDPAPTSDAGGLKSHCGTTMAPKDLWS